MGSEPDPVFLRQHREGPSACVVEQALVRQDALPRRSGRYLGRIRLRFRTRCWDPRAPRSRCAPRRSHRLRFADRSPRPDQSQEARSSGPHWALGELVSEPSHGPPCRLPKPLSTRLEVRPPPELLLPSVSASPPPGKRLRRDQGGAEGIHYPLTAFRKVFLTCCYATCGSWRPLQPTSVLRSPKRDSLMAAPHSSTRPAPLP